MLSYFRSHKQGLAEGDHSAAIERLRHALRETKTAEILLRAGEPGFAGLEDDRFLARWLRAEKWNVESTAERLQKHAEWRVKYVPDGRIPEDDIMTELATEKSCLQGTDKLGRPLVIVVGRRHHRAKRDIQELKRLIVYSLDACDLCIDLKRNPDRKGTAIIDLKGISLENLDAAALGHIFDLLQTHYPESLAKMYLYEAPAIFWVVWRMVQPFIDPVTKAKIAFVFRKDALQEFQANYPPDVLPKLYGGEAELVPVQKMVRRCAGLTHVKVLTQDSWRKGEKLRDLDSAKMSNANLAFPQTPTDGICVANAVA